MTEYADLDDTEEYELPRQCPICGQWEPVCVDVLDWARDEGLPDQWVCGECMLKKEFDLEFDLE